MTGLNGSDIRKPEIVLATANKGKLKELSTALQPYGFDVRSFADFDELPEIEENGSTFQENALIKARIISRSTNKLTLADDSGLIVPALDGQPGIYSARFGDELPFLAGESRDARNIRKLLALMESVGKREACFKSVIALVAPDGKSLLTEGVWEGEITRHPKGDNGFGYDPVFLDRELGKTAAELTFDEKAQRSHRGKAIQNLLRELPRFLS